MKKLNAFTLAEVLITLGVIGVVSAMTMPILIQKHNEQVTITKLKKFYSVMSQAQQQAIAEYGDVENWDWVSDEDNNNANIKIWFDKYFAPYLKTTEVIEHKIVNDNGDDIDRGFIVKFADGTIMNILSFSGDYLHVFYYTNYKTFINGTAKDGKDLFWFGFFHNHPEVPDCQRFQTYLCKYLKSHDTNSETVLKNHSKYGCYSGDGRYCARLIQMNGWKVPSDYPYKF